MRMEESAAGRASTKPNRDAEYKATTRAERANQFSFWKKVRAKVTMSSQTETSAGVSEKSAPSFGGLCGAGAKARMRARANWEGGRKVQK